MELLVTGFEPFGRFATNPSWSAARALAERYAGRVVARLLPVDHAAAREDLWAFLEKYQPSACLCMGLAPWDEFRLEEQARQPAQFAALPGEAQYAGSWDWEPLAAKLQQLHVPHRRSRDAGQYVCESTYWSLLDFARRRGFPLRAGFLHVPAISPRFGEGEIVSIVLQAVGGGLGPT